MPIRFAELQDIPALVELGSRMHALTRFRSQPFDAQRVAQSLSDLMTHGRHRYAFFVAQGAEGRVVGGLIGVLEQQIFSSEYVASVMHFDVLPESRMGGYGVRLLRAFEKWAGNRGAVEVVFGVNSGVGQKNIRNFSERLGYVCIGSNYVSLVR